MLDSRGFVCGLLLGLSLPAAAEPDAGLGPLWGYADLHTHPASHLAFGATDEGGGPIWGTPGGSFETSDPAVDLPPCEPGSHDPGFTLDFVRQISRQQVIQIEDGQTNLPHRSGGWPDFVGWPDSQSLSHQQMHVSWLHRAWEGGLRAVVADAVDTELIALAWQQGLGGKNAKGERGEGEIVRPLPGFDFASAKRQIAFLKDFAAKNGGWMQVVTDSREAEAAIRANKLAVILGVEMDALTLAEVRELYDGGVRHIVPIHLADSETFGGSAVYSDIFNSNTRFQTGSYMATLDGGDARIPFRLSEQMEYAAPLFNTGEKDGGGWRGPLVDIAYPQIWPHPRYCDLHYTPCAQNDQQTVDQGPGQKNGRGLTDGGLPIRELMKLGMLIDVAHMGDESTRQVLALAAAVDGGYPILDTHTDLAARNGGWRNSERDLKREFAKTLLGGGGMIGLGTGPHTNPQLLGYWKGAPFVELSAAHPEFLEGLRATAGTAGAGELDIRIWTGESPLGADRRATLLVYVAGETGPRRIPLPHAGPLARGAPMIWHASPDQVAPLSRLQGFGLKLEGTGASWDVAGLAIGLGSQIGREQPLLSRFGAPLVTLTEGEPEWATTFLPAVAASDRPLERIRLRVTTGSDDLRGDGSDDNDDAVARVDFQDPALRAAGFERRKPKPRQRNPRRPLFGVVRGDAPELPLGVREASLNAGRPLRSGSPGDPAETFVALPDGGIPLAAIDSVDVVTWFRGGLAGDNWNVDGVEVHGLDRDGGETLLATQKSRPWARLTSGDGIVPAYQAIEPLDPELPADHLMATVTTGDDNGLDASATVEALVLLRSRATPLYLPLAAGLAWGTGETRSVVLRLPAGTKLRDIEAFGLRWRPGHVEQPGWEGRWDVKELSLELLSDPVQNWLAAYEDALSIADGGIAMGTDLNGLAPQIQYSIETVAYPFRPEGDPPDAGYLFPAKTGNRTFDLTTDGIAHVGMVPDFLEAARQLDGGPAAIDQMYRTAGELVRLWRRAEEARPSVPP